MFCTQCGTKNEDKAKYCMSCGNKLHNMDEIQKESKEGRSLDQNIQMTILGKDFVVSKNVFERIQIDKKFNDMAITISNDFFEKIWNSYSSLDAFVKLSPQDVEKIYITIDNEIINFLLQHKIYGYNLDSVKNFTRKYTFQWQYLHKEIKQIYDQILSNSYNEKYNREQQKDNRGRVIGGGFGLGNAVKGVVTASIINSTTGLLYSMVNGVSNFSTDIITKSKKNERFNNERFIANIARAISYDCLNMKYGLIEIWNNELKNNLMPIYSNDDFLFAKSICEKIESKKIPEQEIKNAIIQMITTYPINNNFYEIVTSNYPDYASELEKFKQICNIKFENDNYCVSNYISNLAEKIINEPMFCSAVPYLEGSDLDKIIDIIVTSNRNYLGNNVLSMLSGNVKLPTEITNKIGDDEKNLLFYDNSIMGKCTSGILLTDKAYYTKKIRIPLESLEFKVENGDIYPCKNQDSEMLFSMNIYGDKTDGKIIKDLFNLVININWFITDLSLISTNNRLKDICMCINKDYKKTVLSINEKLYKHLRSYSIVKEINANAFKMIQDKYFSLVLYDIIDCSCPKIQELLEGLIKLIDKKKQDEIPLYFYDQKNLGGYYGFVVTTDSMYYRNSEESGYIDLSNIYSLKAEGNWFTRKIIINDSIRIDVMGFAAKEANEFCDDMLAIVIPYLKNISLKN